MYFQQTKSCPKATKKPFTVGKAKAWVRKSLFSSHIRDEKALNKRKLPEGREGRENAAACSNSSSRAKAPASGAKSHTRADPWGHNGCSQGTGEGGWLQTGQQPVFGGAEPPSAQPIAPLQPASSYSPKDATQPPNDVPASTEAIGTQRKQKKNQSISRNLTDLS